MGSAMKPSGTGFSTTEMYANNRTSFHLHGGFHSVVSDGTPSNTLLPRTGCPDNEGPSFMKAPDRLWAARISQCTPRNSLYLLYGGRDRHLAPPYVRGRGCIRTPRPTHAGPVLYEPAELPADVLPRPRYGHHRLNVYGRHGALTCWWTSTRSPDRLGYPAEPGRHRQDVRRG